MAMRVAGGRKLSFEILSRSHSLAGDAEDTEPLPLVYRTQSDPIQTSRKKRKHRNSKKKKKLLEPSIPEDPLADSRSLTSNSVSCDPHSTAPRENGSACHGFELEARRYGDVLCEEESGGSVYTLEAREDASEVTGSVCGGEGFNFGELRLRAVNGGSSEDLAASAVDVNDGVLKVCSVEKPTNETNRNAGMNLEKVESLDWKRLMAEDPNCELNGPCSACIDYYYYYE